MIGIHQSCYDPVFVDLNAPEFPIYKAMVGMGSWEENLICENYESFLNALILVKDLKDRYSNSENVSDEEAQRFMVNIKKIVGDGDLYYWGMYIQLEERDIEFNKALQLMRS